jgi:ketosteroid isomerase-like protein
MQLTRWLGSGLATLVAIVALAVAPASANDMEDVARAVSRFYAALNAMFTGDVAPMEEVWSHGGEVTYLPPDGRLLVGWQDVRASWQKQAALKLGGRVDPENVHINVLGDVAVVCNFEKGMNKVDGVDQTVAIRSSKVFRRENGAWKLMSDHADPLPYLKK